MNGGGYNPGGASLADTGQWRLIVEIFSTGISAFLKNIDFHEIPSQTLFKKSWEDSAPGLLSNVEEAIFSNPRALDDFATHIILHTPKSLWIPSEFTDDDEFDSGLFTCVYPARAEDIAADFGDEEVCLYTMVEGLNSFLQRTLPGSRISSHMSILKGEFQRLEISKMESLFATPLLQGIYVNLIPRHADIFAFVNGRFLCGATHQWKHLSDVAYKALLVADAYGLPQGETELTVVAPEELRQPAADTLAPYFAECSLILPPSMVADGTGSFAASLAAGESFQIVSK